MIDVILNEEGGLVLVHDEKPLDLYSKIEISRVSGSIDILNEDNSRKNLGTLKPSMMEMLYTGMDGHIIRVDGWALSKIKKVQVILTGPLEI